MCHHLTNDIFSSNTQKATEHTPNRRHVRKHPQLSITRDDQQVVQSNHQLSAAHAAAAAYHNLMFFQLQQQQLQQQTQQQLQHSLITRMPTIHQESIPTACDETSYQNSQQISSRDWATTGGHDFVEHPAGAAAAASYYAAAAAAAAVAHHQQTRKQELGFLIDQSIQHLHPGGVNLLPASDEHSSELSTEYVYHQRNVPGL
ncbi:unnamed protein product [Heterobilharzia americana]|nr:unnamed protein product [Heterobilharzia americana]